MTKGYKTSEVASKFGLHPNTIRKYEDLGYITAPKRKSNGHREYTELQLLQVHIVRLALRSELLHNGLRKNAIGIIKLCASCLWEEAILASEGYRDQIDREMALAIDAVRSAEALLSRQPFESGAVFKRGETALKLSTTIDTLRNWEMNGLIVTKRLKNGYRVYDEEDFARLKVIRTLRCANYSLVAILRALNQVGQAPLAEVLNTPKEGEDIVSVCDRLVSSLVEARRDADDILLLIDSWEKNKPPL